MQRSPGYRCPGSHQGRPHGSDCRQYRRKAAEERAEVRASRSPSQQLRELDRKLGAGIGAKRERERLAKAIEKARAA